MPNLAAALDEGGQAHRTERIVGQDPKVAFFVASTEGQGKDFLGEPTVEQPELLFVVYMLEVVIDDGDIADALFESSSREVDEEQDALAIVENASKFGALAPKGEAKKVGDFPEFVARETDTAAGMELEAKVPNGWSGEEIGGSFAN